MLRECVTRLQMHEPRLLIVADKENPKSAQWARMFSLMVQKKPNMIAVIGGDGFMLRTIKKLWRMRLPFFGVNVGHRGFLLNEPEGLANGIPTELIVHELPMLEVETTSKSGKFGRRLAFNDAWVERATTQTAWIEIKVDGVVRVENLIADAALVATPAGSTAYAMAMGASPLPLDARALVLAASNSCVPLRFRPCILPIDSSVEFRALDPQKRPIVGVIDGVRQGRVMTLRATVSQTAKAKLAFVGGRGLAEKLAGIQFAE